jgi:hypothetical protein
MFVMTNSIRGSVVLRFAACFGVILLLQACQQSTPQGQIGAPRLPEAQATSSPSVEAQTGAAPAPQTEVSAPPTPQSQTPSEPPTLPPKTSRTPAQQKLDSHLLAAAQMARSSPKGATDPSLASANQALELDEHGNVHVDIDAKVNDALLAQIANLCGTVESSFPNYATIRAWVPLLSAETLATRPEVTFIKPAGKAILNSQVLTGSATTGLKSIPDPAKGEQDARTQRNPDGNAKSQGGCQGQR